MIVLSCLRILTVSLTGLPPRQSIESIRYFSDRRERSAYYVKA